MKHLRWLLASVAVVATAVLAVQAQVPGVNSTLNAVFTLAYDNSTMKPTYSTSVAGVQPAAAATDFCSLTGSATRTIKVRRVILAGTSTAVQSDPVSILFRTTVTASGTTTALTENVYDTVNSLSGGANSATATGLVYTANGTISGTGNVLVDVPVTFPLTTSVLQQPLLNWQFGALGSPVVLRGTSQQIVVSLNGAFTDVGARLGCTFEWTEEP